MCGWKGPDECGRPRFSWGFGPCGWGGRCAGVAMEQGCNGLGDEAAGSQDGQRASGVCVCVSPRVVWGRRCLGGYWFQQPGWWLQLPAGKGWRWGWVLGAGLCCWPPPSTAPLPLGSPLCGEGEPRVAGSSIPLMLSSSAAEDKLLLCASVSSSAKWE